MLSAPQPSEPLVESWIERHRHPISFSLHVAGVPLTFLGTMLIPIYLGLASWAIFTLALALFLGGYALQFLGHVWDWSEPGEIAGLRSWLGARLRRASARAAAHVQRVQIQSVPNASSSSAPQSQGSAV